jgi:hypothetical protein
MGSRLPVSPRSFKAANDSAGSVGGGPERRRMTDATDT